MEFNENLRALRTKNKITQQELADSVGVTSVTIGNWERGTRLPSFDLLGKLADSLNTSVDSLLGRENTSIKYTLHKVQIAIIDPDTGEIIKSMHLNLDDDKPVQATGRINRHQFKEVVTKDIPYFDSPAAAGVSAPLEGVDFETITVTNNLAKSADFAVRISGDSMSPYIEDGAIVYVKKDTPLNIGDVGIFCVDGAVYCKQYYIDTNKNVHLLSANSERKESNISISKHGNTSFKCFGKVLLENKLPLPHYINKD